MQKLSKKANEILEFVHTYLEQNNSVPSRAQIATGCGYADKRSVKPYLDELYLKGWRQPSNEHRSDNWGGSYARPTDPPFIPIEESRRFVPDIPQMGDS